jgi:hypothetical protein
MSAVRWGESSPFNRGSGWSGGVQRGGDRPAVVVMAINDHQVQWGGEMEGRVGSEEGESAAPFSIGFRRKKKAGRLTGRDRLPVRGRRWGRLGQKGEEERWATVGPKGELS